MLKQGGVVVYPTDTLYGLGANALDSDAVRRVFAVKKRPLAKPLPMLVRNIAWAKELAHISSRQEAILEKVWPGKVTAILEKQAIIPDIVTAGHGTVGMRVAGHPIADALLARFGYPLTATSANISGDEPLRNPDAIVEMFTRSTPMPDLVIDVGTLPESDPSTVVDITAREPKIVRIGASKPDQLLKLLQL